MRSPAIASPPPRTITGCTCCGTNACASGCAAPTAPLAQRTTITATPKKEAHR